MKVLVDTNFLMSVFEMKKDFLGMIEEKYGKGNVFTISIVKDKLKKIEEISDKRKKYAKMALDYLSKHIIKVKKYEGNLKGDDSIIEFCLKNNCILATQDKEMTIKAKKQHLKILKIRQKAYLKELKL